MVTSSRLAAPDTQELIGSVRGDGHSQNAWDGYRELVVALAKQFDAPRMLEVGGGRSPMFDSEEISALNADYTVNDIDPTELARAPASVAKLPGDIADPRLLASEAHVGGFDLIFSHMVFEHVANPRDAYRNISRLLAPGGVLVNFVPTLYAAPFVLNRLLPETISARVLRAVFPKRNINETPKFPAYYRWCTATDRTSRKIRGIGFRASEIVPFYGHGYYAKLPVLRTVLAWFWPIAAKRNWRPLSAYALILAEGNETA